MLPQPKLLQTFYETTLAALEEAKNDRLWFKAKIKVILLARCIRECPRVRVSPSHMLLTEPT